MSTAKSASSSFGALSIELLERIFLFASPQEILRFSLVNRTCRELVQASPSIQYEIDLFAAGLQRNPRIEASTADRRLALSEYRRRWEVLDPVEKWTKSIPDHAENPRAIVISGVHALCQEDRVNFFVLGSASRGIPRREWQIPLRGIELRSFTFFPRADVVAFGGIEGGGGEWEWKIQLRTLSGGEPHPSARTADLCYDYFPEYCNSAEDCEMSLSITSSRIAFFCTLSGTPYITGKLIVWDWTTGDILVDHEDETFLSATFVDDFRLALLLQGEDQPLTLMLWDTKEVIQNTYEMRSAQTVFYFDLPQGNYSVTPELISDPGGHVPPREDELFAPFYPDPSRRILAIVNPGDGALLVTKTETLLRLALERKGEGLWWREWKSHVTWVPPGKFWISGPRVCRAHWVRPEGTSPPVSTLLNFVPGPEMLQAGFPSLLRMDVYDFSPQASGRNTEIGEDGRVQRTAPSATQTLPLSLWQWTCQVFGLYGCHDSLTFVVGSQNPPGYMVHVSTF